jgi:HAD superfamily hydrolase (TIGR01509 family)
MTSEVDMTIEAIIFDMDGVLTDSEPVITKAATLALAEFGVMASEADFHPFTGTGEDRFIGGVAELHGVPYRLEMKKRTYEIYLDIVDAEIGIYPGIPEMLAILSGMGIRLAVASSADAVKVKANLKAAGIGLNLFAAVCSGEDVVHKKPAPDIFLLAAEKLGVLPEKCLVVEDAVTGVKAACAAGMRCVGISTSFPAETLLAAGAADVLPETHMLAQYIQAKLQER